MSEELKKNLRSLWLGILFEAAHIEFQRRLWRAYYPDLVGDSIELICGYFGDLGLEDDYAYFLQKQFISTEEFEIVKDFHFQLKAYVARPEKKYLTDKQMLRDPEWEMICELANRTWKSLSTIITDKTEIDLIHTLEKKYAFMG